MVLHNKKMWITPAHVREMYIGHISSLFLHFPLALSSCIFFSPTSQLKAHSCPPFTGCTVTVTGLEERERRKVRELVERNGGVYSGELTKDVCTHLLVGSTTSMLYMYMYILHIQSVMLDPVCNEKCSWWGQTSQQSLDGIVSRFSALIDRKCT